MIEHTLEVELTNHCKVNCKICPRDQYTRPRGTMDFDVFAGIVDALEKPEATGLVFAGHGDPMLHPQIEVFVDHARQRNIGRLDLIYNPTLATPDIVQRLERMAFDTIEISVPVLAERAFREFYPKSHDYERFLDILGQIKPERFVAKLKFLIFEYGDPVAQRKSRRILASHGLRHVEVCAVDSRAGLLYELDHKIETNTHCAFLDHATSIKWDGKVFLCCQQYNEDVVVGDVRSEPLGDIIARRTEFFPHAMCQDCNCELRYKFDR